MRALILLSFFASSASAQADLSAAFDRIANEELTAQKIPGMSIVVVKEDHIIYAKGFGVTSVETKTPVTADTLFRLGSTTKMFTAAASIQLAEQGKLKLDAPVGNYISGLDPTISRLTAHQLLSHTSGLQDERYPYGPQNEDELGKRIREWTGSKFIAEPGRLFSYSNIGYHLAGLLIEVVRGKPYADAMNELLLGPLGMRSATFRPTLAMTYPLAVGHTAEGVVSRPMRDDAGGRPSGGLMTSGNDFARFVTAFLNDGKLGGEQVLSRSLIETLASPVVREPGPDDTKYYGYGLLIDSSRMVRVVGHAGSTVGYNSDVLMVPEFKTGAIVLVNRDGVDPSIVSRRLLERALPQALRARAVAAPIPSPAADSLGKYAGRYVSWEATVVVSVEGGKLSARREGGTRPIALPPLEPAGNDCFRSGTTTVCFSQGYAHFGVRAYRKQ